MLRLLAERVSLLSMLYNRNGNCITRVLGELNTNLYDTETYEGYVILKIADA